MSERIDTGRSVRLPYAFGDIVYHLVKKEKIAGMVVGFVVSPGGTKILVRWGDDLGQGEHYFMELATEPELDLT